MMDFTSLVKNDSLRFLYSIIIPGVFVSFVSTLIVGHILKSEHLLAEVCVPFTYFIVFVFVIFSFVGGFIVEIIGVYIESEYIDVFVERQKCVTNNEFNTAWNDYLKLNSLKTKNLILVDYYRSILTKMKFLINLPVSLLSSYLLIILSHCLFNIDFFNLNTLEGYKGFVCLGLLIAIVSWLSYRRAKHCALILFDARKDLMFHANTYI